MTTQPLALARRYPATGIAAAVAVSGIATLALLVRGITCNQTLALVLTLLVLTIWQRDKLNGALAATIFFVVKAFFVRLAFAGDWLLSGSGGLDLLGITPALLLSLLVVWQIYLDFVAQRPVFAGRTRKLLGLFCLIGILSIFNPLNSLWNGLAGLERVILPNMLILFLFASLVRETEDAGKIVKTFLLLGLASCAYAVGQFALGAYPWEIPWLREVAFSNSTQALTVGLRGIELRIFSLFYGYMDFTFTNVLIFALVFACSGDWSRGWRRLRLLYFAIWIVVLILTLERMPLLMTLIATGVILFVRSDRQQRKVIVRSAIGVIGAAVIILGVFSSTLRDTGAAKFIRLAELANPLSATSLWDRWQRDWIPTAEVIATHPLGVGIGYGSSTVATAEAQASGLWRGPHNELLQKGLELGIPGALVFGLLLFSAFRDSLLLVRERRRGAAFAAGMIGATIGFWVCGIVNLPFIGASGLVYWAMAGVLAATNGRTSILAAKDALSSAALTE